MLRLNRNGEPVINSFKPPKTKQLARIRVDPRRQSVFREWILTAERALLYTIGFKFSVLHPHSTVANVAAKYKLEGFVIQTPGTVRLNPSVRSASPMELGSWAWHGRRDLDARHGVQLSSPMGLSARVSGHMTPQEPQHTAPADVCPSQGGRGLVVNAKIPTLEWN